MKLKKGDHKPKELDSKEVMQEKNSNIKPIVYEDCTFKRTIEENSTEFEVTILDKFNPYHNALKIYKFKIADDIQIFYKVIDVNTNEIGHSFLKSIPYIGIEKITFEYTLDTWPEYDKLNFKFIFCHKNCDTNTKPNIIFDGYACSSLHPDEIRENFYEIQQAIQQAISKEKKN
ncbi:hypothetical protein HB665_15365 [Bacillus paranthracis]|uniref:hypothetical protein n=1 Tax=Bacillus paranthracis TaxID=2026186 RepID=UPI0014443217|nr:hypothetical protein [Bacillus paranthracis]NKX25545.1 hypothetical protein [Bacillus paranthracis]